MTSNSNLWSLLLCLLLSILILIGLGIYTNITKPDVNKYTKGLEDAVLVCLNNKGAIRINEQDKIVYYLCETTKITEEKIK